MELCPRLPVVPKIEVVVKKFQAYGYLLFLSLLKIVLSLVLMGSGLGSLLRRRGGSFLPFRTVSHLMGFYGSQN